MREAGRFMFYIIDFFKLYFDAWGLAAAKIAVLAFNWQTIPALAIEIVCCYIASSNIILEFSSILSN